MGFKRITAVLVAIMVAAALAACSRPQEKKVEFFDSGRKLYDDGNFVKARLEFKNALQIDGKFADAYYWLGRTEEKLGSVKEAFSSYAKAAKLQPGMTDAQLKLARMLLLGRAADKAMEKVQVVLDKDPGNDEALTLKSAVLLVRGETGPAIRLLEEMIQKGDAPVEVYQLLAQAHAVAKDEAAAEAVYRQGLAAHPDAVSLHLSQARFYQRSGRMPEAIAAVDQVIQLEPGRTSHRFYLADLYWREGRRDEAVALVDAILAEDGADVQAWSSVAGFYMHKEQADLAEQTIKKGTTAHPDSIKLHLLLGELYLRGNKLDQARETLVKCLTLEDDPAAPEIVSAKNQLTDVYLALRETGKAEAYVNDVLKASPNNVTAHMNKGRIYLIKGDGANAVSEFRTVVHDRPSFIPGYLGQADAHVLNRELELAAEVLKSGLKVNPESTDALKKLAGVMILKKDYESAREDLRKVIVIDPTDTLARAQLGDLLVGAKDYTGAGDAYLAIKQYVPKSPLGYLRMSRLYARQQKPDLALVELEEGYGANPDATELLTTLVRAYAAFNQHEKALSILDERIAADPKDALSYGLKGWVHYLQKDYGPAEAALETAIEIQPSWTAPYNDLARVYVDQGRKKEAVQRYESALQVNPKNAYSWLFLGTLYQKDQDYAKAMETYERALKELPDFWVASNNLAFLLSENSDRKDDYVRAVALAEAALKRRPNSPGILDTLGWAQYRVGDLTQAVDTLGRALKEAPDSQALNYHMGMVLYKSGRVEESRLRLEKSLEEDTDFIGRAEAEKTLEKIEAKG